MSYILNIYFSFFQSMLVELFSQGPYTVGIFRRSANVRVCREVKERLESDPEFDMKNVPIIILSSVFKVHHDKFSLF